MACIGQPVVADIVEIHGNLQTLACTGCLYEEATGDMGGREIPPLCPACGGVLRPKVVLFGEALPEDELDRFIDAFQEGFDIVFSIGTSSIFPYIVQPIDLCCHERDTDCRNQSGPYAIE